MAMTQGSKSGVWGARLHFGVRFLGLLGVIVACAGLVLARSERVLNAPEDLLAGNAGLGGWLILGGGTAALLALLGEILVILRFAAGKRSAFGVNAMVQVVLAFVLVVGLNVWSFDHSLRLDWTREQQFTLPDDLREQLARLNPDEQTTVIVYLRHKTLASLSEVRTIRYDSAAERKVVEKVKDMVALLREVGPQLRVEVLDVSEDGFDDQLERLTENSPELRKAIEAAPENSIFITSSRTLPDGTHPIQQMSFSELYHLDKVRSLADNGERGNLVLLGQGDDGRGLRPFVRRILNLEQKRPRVGILVIHELLTTQGSEDMFTAAGLKTALTAQGFDVRDIILKKGVDNPRLPPQPAADTLDESRLERLETQLEGIEKGLAVYRLRRKAFQNAIDEVKATKGEDTSKKLDELTKKYARMFEGGGRITAKKRETLEKYFTGERNELDEEIQSLETDRKRVKQQRDKLDVEQVAESRRLKDIKAKLSYAIADCDLLFIPRLTRRSTGMTITPRIHHLSSDQVEAIKDFMKAGKPILVCLGPVNEEGAGLAPAEDDLERLLAQVGIKASKQTVLFSDDTRDLQEAGLNFLRRSEPVKIPDLDFDNPTPLDPRPGRRAEQRVDNPLRRGLRILSRSAGSGFDLKMRFPRPIYFDPPKGTKLTQDPAFLITGTGWNEDNPFMDDEKGPPRYSPPPPDDPNRGTLDIRRRDRFPVGIAVQVAVPGDWKGTSKYVRLAVIGQGEVFVGNTLTPAKEKLFLQTANWLLGRTDALPRDDSIWKYPRLDLVPGDTNHELWLWTVMLGLPVLFATLGLIVLLYRRLR